MTCQKSVTITFISGISNDHPTEEWKAQRNLALVILRNLGWGKQSIQNKTAEEASVLLEIFHKTAGQPFDPHRALAVR